MSGFPVFTFRAILFLAGDGPVSAQGGYGLPYTLGSCLLMFLLYGSCETLENMGALEVLHKSGFEIFSGFMANCHVPDVGGCGVGLQGFLPIFTKVMFLMFNGVARLRPFVGERIENIFIFVLYQVRLCFSYQGITVHFRQLCNGCVSRCLNIVHLVSQAQMGSQKILSFVI